jgi:hypothetical protein
MPLPLRADFGASHLRSFARRTKDGPQARRLLALAAIYDGVTRTETAKIGGVTLQIVRDWVVKFNAHGPRRSHRQEGSRPSLAAERLASSGTRQGDRRGTHPSDPWCRALAAHRSLPMGLRGVPRRGLRADAQPRTAGDGISPALRSSASSCSGRRGDRGF